LLSGVGAERCRAATEFVEQITDAWRSTTTNAQHPRYAELRTGGLPSCRVCHDPVPAHRTTTTPTTSRQPVPRLGGAASGRRRASVVQPVGHDAHAATWLSGAVSAGLCSRAAVWLLPASAAGTKELSGWRDVSVNKWTSRTYKYQSFSHDPAEVWRNGLVSWKISTVRRPARLAVMASVGDLS